MSGWVPRRDPAGLAARSPPRRRPRPAHLVRGLRGRWRDRSLRAPAHAQERRARQGAQVRPRQGCRLVAHGRLGKAVTDQTTFIETAAALEPVGTAAYAGAGPDIYTLAILKAALSIHSVEANHAAWAASLLEYKQIDPSAKPAPHANNPAYGYKKVLRIVGKTGFVKGNLHP